MAQYFDFTYLINKYSSDFVAEIPSEGSYNDMGRWVEGSKTQETLHGAIISHRQSKIFKSGGTITEKDMALYMLEPLKNSLQGAKIAYEGKNVMKACNEVADENYFKNIKPNNIEHIRRIYHNNVKKYINVGEK